VAGPPEVEALVRRHGLSLEAGARLQTLLELVVSDRQSPTSVRQPVGVLNDHLADSLAALELSQLGSAQRVVDIGSGAGFPGLPLAIALPSVEFTLLESAVRKCGFIQRGITACRLQNARAVHARAEAWAEGLDRFDVATARALAPLEVVLEYAAPLLEIDGHLIAWRGRRDPVGEARAATAAARLGMRIEEVVRVIPYPGAEHRHLHVAKKVSATPPGFPRRPGMAVKRPLGGPAPNTGS